MTNIKHIVFDVGCVLINWNPEIPFRDMIPDQTKRQWFLSEVCTGEWNIEQDRGRTWEDGEQLLIEQYPEEEFLIRGYRRHWLEMIHSANEASARILEALVDNGKDVTLLTNFSQETFPLAKEKFPFLGLPRGETVSGEIGLLKPDKAIYDHHIETHDLDPAATLFFDDNQKNVDGARGAGWQAELFTDAGRMQEDLEKYGVQ